jgi:hypothetical protein
MIWSTAHQLRHASKLGGVVERSIQNVFIGLASFCCRNFFSEYSNKVVVHTRSNNDTSCSSAVLTGVEQTSECNSFGGGFNIGIVKYHHRGFASQLQMHSLQTGSCGLRHFYTSTHASCDRHHCWRVVCNHCSTRIAVATDDVEYTRWKKLCSNFCEERGGGWSGVRWLQHNGIACG